MLKYYLTILHAKAIHSKLMCRSMTKDMKQTINQSKEVEDINKRITDQGNAVRTLKEKKAAKVSGVCEVSTWESTLTLKVSAAICKEGYT